MGMFLDVGMDDVERDNRRNIVEVHLTSLQEDGRSFYIFKDDDEWTPHDLGQYWEFIDTGRLACGLTIELEDDMAVIRTREELDGEDPLEVCEDCQAALIAYNNLTPDQKLTRQVVAATEATMFAKRAHVKSAGKAAEMIVELDADSETYDDDEDAIYAEIQHAHLLFKHHNDAVDDFDKVMKKSTKKFSSWGYREFPSELLEMAEKQSAEYDELEKDVRVYFEFIYEFLKARRERHLGPEPEEESTPVTPPPPTESREERIARKRAEREERERQALENQQIIVRKPVKRNRKLEQAIAAVRAAPKNGERVAALRVLRQMALEAGDEEWASYAKQELRGTRDSSP